MTEIWKDIEGYEGLYQVSTKARVKRTQSHIHTEPYILKQRIGDTGYYEVFLCKNGKSKKHKVHRLVAKAFVPNPKHLPQVSHIDETKTNNSPDNLVWATGKENCRMPLHRIRCSVSQTGKCKSEETKARMRASYGKQREYFKNRCSGDYKVSRKVLQYTKEGDFVREYASLIDAQKTTGIWYTHISACCYYKRKSAGGYVWKFR